MTDQPITFRRARPEDLAQVAGLVRDVVVEIYGDLLPQGHDLYEELAAIDRTQSWVAVRDSRVVGVGLAEGDTIHDLWVRSAFRDKGIGGALLRKMEAQIARDGHDQGRLRAVARNTGARRFYARHGWRETKTYPHERWGNAMVDFRKPLGGPAEVEDLLC